MTHTYNIEGMTCEGCLYKVQSTLAAVEGITKAEVNLEANSATLKMSRHVQTETLEAALQQAGSKYHIKDIDHEHHVHAAMTEDLPEANVTTYKPLLMIVGFIAGTTLLAQWPFDSLSWMTWMRHFMAGFFIVFAFFKLLNLEGFAMSYRMYDIVAAKWKSWAFIYPFVELALGVAYLINWNPTITNWATVVVLGVSSIGVIQSNLNKRKIKCACLGDVFNLPMSTVTIVEDLSMVAMAAWMLAA
ncbi:MAG: cation transporter [Flavobacteriales bacterium]